MLGGGELNIRGRLFVKGVSLGKGVIGHSALGSFPTCKLWTCLLGWGVWGLVAVKLRFGV